MKKNERTNNYIQTTTHKTKDRVTRTTLKTPGVNPGAPEGEAVPDPGVVPSCNDNGIL